MWGTGGRSTISGRTACCQRQSGQCGTCCMSRRPAGYRGQAQWLACLWQPPEALCRGLPAACRTASDHWPPARLPAGPCLSSSACRLDSRLQRHVRPQAWQDLLSRSDPALLPEPDWWLSGCGGFVREGGNGPAFVVRADGRLDQPPPPQGGLVHQPGGGAPPGGGPPGGAGPPAWWGATRLVAPHLDSWQPAARLSAGALF
jgi:hypothetical protein